MKIQKILFGFILLIGAKHSPAQKIDYNTGLKNQPFFSASGSASLNAAIQATPSGGVLVTTPITYTLTTTITITKPIVIQCAKSTSFNAGISNLTAFSYGNVAVTFDGCTFDGQFSQHGYTGTTFINSTGSPSGVLKNSTLQNATGTILLFTKPTNLNLLNNTCNNIGNGTILGSGTGPCIAIFNATNLNIDGLYGSTFTSDDMLHVLQNAISASCTNAGGGVIRIANIAASTFSRFAVEMQGPCYQHTIVENWTTSNFVAGSGIANTISGAFGFSTNGTLTQSNYSTHVHNIHVFQPATASPVLLAIETFGDDIEFSEIAIDGPWSGGIGIGGMNNHISKAKIGAGVVNGIAQNTSINSASGLTIRDSNFIESVQTSIGLANCTGVVIDNNTFTRTVVSTDTSNTYQSIVLGNACASPFAKILNNNFTLLAGTVPSGATYYFLGSYQFPIGVNIVRGNTLTELNTTPLLVPFTSNTGDYSFFDIADNNFYNIASFPTPSAQVGMAFRNNKSFLGVGSGTPATAFYITPTTKAQLVHMNNGASNICSDCFGSPSGSACIAGGTNTNITATNIAGTPMCYGAPGQTSAPTTGSLGANVTSITANTGGGDQYNFLVVLVVGGTISSVEKLGTLTFSKGFAVQPNFCTISSLGLTGGPVPIGIQGTSATTVDLYGGIPTLVAGTYYYPVRCP